MGAALSQSIKPGSNGLEDNPSKEERAGHTKPESFWSPLGPQKCPPADFIKRVQHMCEDISLCYTAENFWFPKHYLDPEHRVCIFENITKKYTLSLTYEILQHSDDIYDDSTLFTIISDPQSDPEKGIRYEYVLVVEPGLPDEFDPVLDEIDLESAQTLAVTSPLLEAEDTKPSPPTVCVFAALGWLVEHEKTYWGSGVRTTYYAVILNLSTTPVSVWLMYDYHMIDDGASRFRWTNRLGLYQNGLYGYEEAEYVPVDDDKFEHSDAAGKENVNLKAFRTQHTNLESMRPIKYRDQPEGNEDSKSPEFVSNFALISRPSSAPHDPPRTQQRLPLNQYTWRRGATVCIDQSWYPPKRQEKGYFGLPLFDLALLAPDVNTWTVEGFDQQQVKQCLDNSHIRLGSSMRTQAATEAQIQAAKDKRVNIKDLCF